MQVAAVVTHRGFDLRSQLACGGQHQGTDGLAAQAALRCLALGQTVQHGQGEGCCFACASLCAGKQVVASQHERNGLGLDRGGFGVALFVHSLENGRGQLEFFECHEVMNAPIRGAGVSALR